MVTRKLWISVAVACLLLGSLYIPGILPNAQETPRRDARSPQSQIVFDRQTIDIGEVSSALGELEEVFVFENRATHPVRIDSVRTSCGCAAAQFSREPILPAHKGSIHFHLNTEKLTGVFTHNILVVFSGPEPLQQILKIQGEAIRVLETRPTRLQFGDFDVRGDCSLSFLLENHSQHPLSVRSIKSEGARLVVSCPQEVLGPKETISVSVHPASTCGTGLLTDQVVIECSDEQGSVVKTSVEVYGWGNAGDTYSTAKLVNLGFIKVGETVTRTTYVKTAGATPFVISHVDCNDPLVQVEYDKEKKTTHAIRVGIQRVHGMHEGLSRSTVTVFTEAGNEKTRVEVPITFYIFDGS